MSGRSHRVLNLNLKDMETCYKAFCREVIQSSPLEGDPSGLEPEITVKVARRNLRMYEVGISYAGRTYDEGKKMGWKEGVRALWCLTKYGFFEPRVRAGDAITAPICSSWSDSPHLTSNTRTAE
jgi:hypothetical protein